ncbi:MAG: MATE family efflux transporter, partial [Pseudomonadota bacterium]
MSEATALPEPFGARLLRHWRALGALAWPVVLSRTAILFMVIVDVVMVGRHDASELAGFSLGLAVF